MSLLSQQRHYIYLRYRLTTLATVFLFAYVCCIHSVQADTSSKTAVNLGIINSFSGSTSFADTGALVYIDGTYYTCEQEIQISLFSDTTSSYILSGNDLINSVTGVEIGPYTEIVDITLAGSDGSKNIPAWFSVGSDLAYAPALEVFLDTTPPSTPFLNYPTMGITVHDNIPFSWSSSVDTGAGLQEYTIVISTTASFSSPITYTTTLNSLSVDKDLIPLGNIYRYVEATDHVGKTSQSMISFFEHRITGSLSSLGGNSNANSSSGGQEFYVDNVSLDSFDLDDPYECGGNLRGYVYASSLDGVYVDVHLHGENNYIIRPLLDETGYYYIPIEYEDTSSPRYIAAGQYAIEAVGTHPVHGKRTYNYEAIIIADCNEIKTPPPVYIKKRFDSQHIKDQNKDTIVSRPLPTSLEHFLVDTPTEGNVFAFPQYLHETGADPSLVEQHLTKLMHYATTKKQKTWFAKLLHTLHPGWYVGIWLLIVGLCYDIEYIHAQQQTILKKIQRK